MRRIIRNATLMAICIVFAGVGTAAANGGPTTEPAPSSPLEFAAGDPCAFGVRLEPIQDSVVVRTWPARANGDIIQIYSGTLKSKATNTDTGRSIRFDNSGSARVVLHADGTADIEYSSPSVIWNLAEELGRDGLWLTLLGHTYEHYDADFNLISQRLAVGRLDLCRALR
jgi:hypothetical protein